MQKKRLRTTVDLLHGSIFRSLLVFSVPFIISALFQQLYNTVDVMVVGNMLGEASLAAIGASTPIYDLLVGFAIGVGNGLAVVTARAFGSGDRQLLKRSCAMALSICLVLGLIITLIAQFGTPALLRLLHTPEDIFAETIAYISTITLFVIVTVLYNLLAGLLRAVGDSVAPMAFLMISSLLNIGLDIAIIPAMGIRGAAVATVIAQGVSVALTLVYILKKHPEIVPERALFRWDKPLFAEMITQGLSMGLMSCIVYMGTLVLQYGINGMGYLVIAGHTAARRIFSFCNIPFLNIGHAMATFASQNCGAGQFDRIRRGIRDVAIMELGLTILITALMYPLAPVIARWLTGSEEAVIIENCSRYVHFFCPFFIVVGTLFTLRNALQGLGEKTLPLISSMIEMVGKILFTLLLVPPFGYSAVIVCEPVIWVLMTLQLMYAFYTRPEIRRAKGM